MAPNLSKFPPIRAYKALNSVANRLTDYTVAKLLDSRKFLNNKSWFPAVRVTEVVDSCQPCVTMEAPRYSDHMAHLRVPAKAPPIQLPTPPLQLPPPQTFRLPMNNPRGLLGIPGLSSPHLFEQVAIAAVEESKNLLIDPRSFSSAKRAVQTMDLISNLLCNIADAAEMVRQLHPEHEWRLVSVQAVQRVQSFIAEVNVDTLIYDRLRTVEFALPTSQTGQLATPQTLVDPVKAAIAAFANQQKLEAMQKEERTKDLTAGAKLVTDKKTEAFGTQNHSKSGAKLDSSPARNGPIKIAVAKMSPTDLGLNPDGRELEGRESNDIGKPIRNEIKNDWVEQPTNEERIVLRLMREAMEQQGVHIHKADDKKRCLQLLAKEQRLASSLAQGPSHSVNDLWLPRHVVETLGVSGANFASRRGTSGETEVNVLADSSIASQLLLNCPLPEIRKRVWEANHLQSSRSDREFQALISTRQQLAKLRGFDDWSRFAKREGILTTHRDVDVFLSRTLEALMPGLEREMSVLRELKVKWNSKYAKEDLSWVDGYGGEDTCLQPWDLPFFMSRFRKMTSQDIHKKLCGRLSVKHMIQFYGKILESLFNVVLNPAYPHEAELWHWSIMKFHVMKKAGPDTVTGDPIGTLYLDLFDRPDKTQIDAQFSIRGSRMMNYTYRHALSNHPLSFINIFQNSRPTNNDKKNKENESSSALSEDELPETDPLAENEFRQAPCCVLTLNIQAPLKLFGTENLENYLDQSFLSPSDARNLFHELGHVTHALLSSTNLQHLSGTRGSVDFTEFPSHLFEHFILDASALSHGLTLKQGDRALMDLYQKQAQLMGHFEAAGLALKTAVDQIVHSTSTDTLHLLSQNNQTLQQHVEAQLDSLPAYRLFKTKFFDGEVDVKTMIGVPLITKFEHLIHYGGTFHAYLFNRVVSSWVWRSGFRRCLLNNREAGVRLHNILQKGSVDTSIKPILHLFPSTLSSMESRQASASKSEKMDAKKLINEELMKDPSQVPLKDWVEGLALSLP